MALTTFADYSELLPVNRAFFAARQAVLLLHDVAHASRIAGGSGELERWVTDEALLVPEIGEVLLTMKTIGYTMDAVRRTTRVDATVPAMILCDVRTMADWAMAKCAALLIALGPAEPVTDEAARRILESARARAITSGGAAPTTAGAAS